MKNKILLMKTASVLAYICAGFYAVSGAWCFSLTNKSYWIFACLALISMYLGILTTGVREKMSYKILSKEDNVKFLIITVISILAPPVFLFNLIAYFIKQDKIVSAKDEEEGEIKKAASKEKNRKKYFALSAVSLCIIIVFSFLAMAINTSGFDVMVTSKTLTKEMTEKYNTTPLNGNKYIIDDSVLSYSYDIYKPKSATADNKAPVVFVIAGFTRTKQTQAQYCIELSMRGFVVFCLDPGSQGGTTTAGYKRDEKGNYLLDDKGNRIAIGATSNANGLNYLVQYVYNNTEEFNYIDRNKIGATGHSAGGGNVVNLAKSFAGANYEESIIKSLYISGYIKLSSINSYKSLNCNAALDYAYLDEGRYRYLSEIESFEVAATRFINEVNGAEEKYDDFILNYGYGNMDDGTYRIIYNDEVFHSFEPYDINSVAHTTDFFCNTLNIETGIDAYNQIWWLKEICTGIALIFGFVFVVGMSGLLLTTKFFTSVKGKEIAPIKKQTTSDKLIFWSTTVLTATIACLDYIPLAGLSILMFPDAHATRATFYFPARMINAVMLWAVVNGTIGLIIFFGVNLLKNLVEKFRAKSQNREAEYDFEQYKAIKIGIKDFTKTLLLAIILFASFYFVVQVMFWVFNVDFRFMFNSASPINFRFFVTWLIYIPFFFIFYISNSIRVNCGMTFENWKEWKRMLVGGLANSVGLVFILIINYVPFFKTGIVYYTYSPAGSEVWLFVNIIFGLLPLMFILPIFNRIFYKQTNRVWLGPIIMCMLFIMMSISASVSYIPL